MDLSDNLLIDGVRQGDDEAFNALFLRYHEQVYRVLLRLLDSHDSAEDLTQETFVQLYRHPPSNGRSHNLGAWLYRVALNLGHNALRAERRRDRRQEKAAVPEGDRWIDDPAKAVVAGEEREGVRRILSELPANYQSCLILRHSGLSYVEIAGVLGISPNAVGTVLARAEKQFRSRYLVRKGGQGGGDT